jgi:CRP-like cAMP-binding protein
MQSYAAAIAAVPVFATLPADAHNALAKASRERLFAHGETIVREGDPGASMFIVQQGRVAITVGPERREVAVTQAGGYFGEMSLLTGDPRTATVTARGDCLVVEISADAFREYVQQNPAVIDRMAMAAAERRKALDQTRAAGSMSAGGEHLSLAQKMRRFFGLG